jgi:6-phosphogluconolactonase (cycloisomerase 2 family)
MRVLNRPGVVRRAATVLVGCAAVAALSTSVPALAATRGHHFGYPGGAVFVQTDNTAGNQVVAYQRDRDGALSLAGTYATGGLGGQLTGSVVDHLASQGSLVLDQERGLLFAVNAGSNTVSVFAVRGDRLALREVIGSGGAFPVSVAVHGDLVYVLNALGGGTVQGYYLQFGHLFPIQGSSRPLGLAIVTGPAQFTNTPGQVAFSPDGSQLIVTTKMNGNDIDVFGVRSDGRLTTGPVANSEPGTVPFGVIFDQAGQLVIADAGTDALATYSLAADGVATLIDSAGTGQAATCWVARDGGQLFASNAGSANVSGYSVAADGALSLLGQTSTDPGTVDAVATPGGRFLYVQTGGTGTVDEFAVGAGGSLSPVGSVLVAGAVGGEGIAAS